MNAQPPVANEKEEKETGRIEAFSDGVFAIIITLLAFNLRVPPLDEAGGVPLLARLAAQWPAYLSFLLSFVTIGVMWMNHHRMFNLIRRSNHVFMILNGLLLMMASVVPFTTALLSEYLTHPDATVAALVYNGTFFVLALVFNIMWRYAAGRLLARDANMTLARVISAQYRYGQLFYLTTLLAGFVSVPLSIALNITLAVYFAVSPPPKVDGK